MQYVVPTKRAISEELWRKNGYSLSSRYFPIHGNEKTNKRLDKTRINENFGQYSFLSLVCHFVCFENDHRRGDHVMVGDVDYSLASSKTGILPNCSQLPGPAA